MQTKTVAIFAVGFMISLQANRVPAESAQGGASM
jgi:hypothetical protein